MCIRDVNFQEIVFRCLNGVGKGAVTAVTFPLFAVSHNADLCVRSVVSIQEIETKFSLIHIPIVYSIVLCRIGILTFSVNCEG